MARTTSNRSDCVDMLLLDSLFDVACSGVHDVNMPSSLWHMHSYVEASVGRGRQTDDSVQLTLRVEQTVSWDAQWIAWRWLGHTSSPSKTTQNPQSWICSFSRSAWRAVLAWARAISTTIIEASSLLNEKSSKSLVSKPIRFAGDTSSERIVVRSASCLWADKWPNCRRSSSNCSACGGNVGFLVVVDCKYMPSKSVTARTLPITPMSEIAVTRARRVYSTSGVRVQKRSMETATCPARALMTACPAPHGVLALSSTRDTSTKCRVPGFTSNRITTEKLSASVAI